MCTNTFVRKKRISSLTFSNVKMLLPSILDQIIILLFLY
nr:MAG TPA: hypothetical protein [Bacteriophage sp.]